MSNIIWENQMKLPSKNYKCGHCNNPLATDKGYRGKQDVQATRNLYSYIYICHFCLRPTFFDYNNKQIPGEKIGSEIKHLEDQNLKELYHEANSCYTIGAYTSAVMGCRKLLMNIAVKQKAKEGLSFVKYVDYLNDNNFIPPNGKEWVDSIRKMGNEANHKIEFKSKSQAHLILTFIEMLLRFIYEMPGLMKESFEENVPKDSE